MLYSFFPYLVSGTILTLSFLSIEVSEPLKYKLDTDCSSKFLKKGRLTMQKINSNKVTGSYSIKPAFGKRILKSFSETLPDKFFEYGYYEFLESDSWQGYTISKVNLELPIDECSAISIRGEGLVARAELCESLPVLMVKEFQVETEIAGTDVKACFVVDD